MTDEKFTWQKFKGLWEVRLLFIILRLIVAAGVILYILLSVTISTTWLEIKYIRLQSATSFEKILEKSIENDSYDTALRWMALRPAKDTPVLQQAIEERSAHLPSTLFIFLAQRLEGEERSFWMMLGKYRLRFDLLRCGGKSAVDRVNQKMDAVYQAIGGDVETDTLLADKVALANILHRVLDFDARHPAGNSPYAVCAVAKEENVEYIPAPETEWAAIRHTLRLVTEGSIGRINQ